MPKVFLFILICIILTGCEKEVTVDLPQGEEHFVVEGHIENGQFPYVILTKDAPYFASVDTADLDKYFVKGADVKVSNGDTTISMMEIQDGIYVGFSMIGEVNKSYDLTIIVEGKTLTSTTYIPTPMPQIDSLWAIAKEGYSNVFRIWFTYSDPDTTGNNIKIFTKVNDDIFRTFLFSTFDDHVINGKTFDDIIRNGIDESCYPENPADTASTSNFAVEECGLFKIGDTVEVKISSIDRAHFDFWRTLETESSNSGGPFSSPTVIKSNIEGGLGIWGGYGSVTRTIIVK